MKHNYWKHNYWKFGIIVCTMKTRMLLVLSIVLAVLAPIACKPSEQSPRTSGQPTAPTAPKPPNPDELQKQLKSASIGQMGGRLKTLLEFVSLAITIRELFDFSKPDAEHWLLSYDAISELNHVYARAAIPWDLLPGQTTTTATRTFVYTADPQDPSKVEVNPQPHPNVFFSEINTRRRPGQPNGDKFHFRMGGCEVTADFKDENMSLVEGEMRCTPNSGAPLGKPYVFVAKKLTP